MSLSSTLFSIQRAISSHSNDLEEKIDRLRQAKNDINFEQDLFLQEIKKIKQPDLGRDWTGKRADDFDREREDAYVVMQRIGQINYTSYQRFIESKINSLEIQQNFLNVSKSLAHEAGQLLDMGEEAADELADLISDLKRRVF